MAGGRLRFVSRRHQRACEVAWTLAWAVTNNLPVDDALESLLPTSGRYVLGQFLGSPFITGLLAIPFFERAAYDKSLQKTADALRDGAAIPDALERHLGWLLPSHYRLGVRQAAAAGKLAELLPVLAQALCRHGMASRTRPAAGWMGYLVVLAAALLTVWGVTYFMVPKFRRMMVEMGDGADVPPLLRAVARLSDWLTAWSPNIYGLGGVELVGVGVVTVALFVHLLFSCLDHLPFGQDWRQAVLPGAPLGGVLASAWALVPGLGRLTRLRLELDVAQQMAVALLAGQDVVPAADELRRRSPWLLVRWRLARFARVAGAGADWVAAWRATRLFGPLPQWLIENAAARADVPGGFQLVADWAMEELTQWQRRFDGWLMLGLTVVTGTLAGVTVVAIFQTLIRLVATVAEY